MNKGFLYQSGALRDKSLAQVMEALRANKPESALADFHALRQGFSPPNLDSFSNPSKEETP